MNILLVTGAYPPADKHGGPAITNHYLAKALQDQGHTVFVLTTDINGSERLSITVEDTVYEDVPVRYCRWLRCPLPYHSPVLGRELARRALSFDVALISSSWTMYGVYAGRSCRATGLPYIMYGHGSYGPVHLRRSRLKKKIFWQLFDKQLYNNAAAVVALNGFEYDRMCNMGIRAPISIIPNGVQTDEVACPQTRAPAEQRWPQLRERPYLLFLGRLEKIKGLDLLIPAFDRARRAIPGLMLVIAGPGERGYGEYVRQLIDQRGLADEVVCTGAVQGDVKYSLLQHAELLVQSSYGEGLPMTVLEAMAAGTVVVITEGCNMPEVQNVDAGLVVPAEVTSLAQGIMTVMADPGRRTEMAAHGRALIDSTFTWQKVAAATAELCRTIKTNRGDNL
ncbi:MAG: glycosyltransferase [Deltaproteobacteria bacterium]|nr:glycosyltransferase [Deltaproteobacteria bacterium]